MSGVRNAICKLNKNSTAQKNRTYNLIATLIMLTIYRNNFLYLKIRSDCKI